MFEFVGLVRTPVTYNDEHAHCESQAEKRLPHGSNQRQPDLLHEA
jgi:hypothetical protein